MPFIANIAAKLASKYLGEYFDGALGAKTEAFFRLRISFTPEHSVNNYNLP